MRIGIVAGELSGDILGAGLMQALQQRFPDAEFVGVGGPRMLALGFASLFDMERLAVMGFVEPLKRLPELLGMRKALREYFLQQRPDVFIGIDSPDFNLNLELALRRAGIKTVHYVSPSVWAWRQRRIIKIKKAVDLMLTLLPFEADFYRQHQVPVCFVGHPLADQFSSDPQQQNARKLEARQALGYSDRDSVVALLPGSRGGEVKLLAEPFLLTVERCLARNSRLKFILPAANAARMQQLRPLIEQYQSRLSALADSKQMPLQLLEGNSHQAMAAADVVLMASGTTSLEALLLNKPMVVAYKLAPLSYAIMSRLLKAPYISLPNLLGKEPLAPELIQHAATPEAMADAVMKRLNDTHLVQQLQQAFLQIHRDLQKNASDTAAAAIAELMAQKTDGR